MTGVGSRIKTKQSKIDSAFETEASSLKNENLATESKADY